MGRTSLPVESYFKKNPDLFSEDTGRRAYHSLIKSESGEPLPFPKDSTTCRLHFRHL